MSVSFHNAGGRDRIRKLSAIKHLLAARECSRSESVLVAIVEDEIHLTPPPRLCIVCVIGTNIHIKCMGIGYIWAIIAFSPHATVRLLFRSNEIQTFMFGFTVFPLWMTVLVQLWQPIHCWVDWFRHALHRLHNCNSAYNRMRKCTWVCIAVGAVHRQRRWHTPNSATAMLLLLRYYANVCNALAPCMTQHGIDDMRLLCIQCDIKTRKRFIITSFCATASVTVVELKGWCCVVWYAVPCLYGESSLYLLLCLSFY